jgi:maltose O-acetyltransferase
MKLNGFFIKLRFKIRYWIYKKHFKKCGENLKIFGRITCIGKNIEIGNNSTLNEGVLLNSRTNLKIGSYVHISPYVQVHTGALDIKQPYNNRMHYSRSVVIEDGVWLCAGVIVNPGVRIGKGSVVAAGSVVNDNIPEYEIWGGIPARKIKDL